MLYMKMVRENPDNIRKMLKDRTVEFDLDSLLDLDKKRRELSFRDDAVCPLCKDNNLFLAILRKSCGSGSTSF